MNIRAHIRNHINFNARGPVFNTSYPLMITVRRVSQDVVVSLWNTTNGDSYDYAPGELIDERCAGWVGDDEKKMQASIREVAAKMIEKTRFYA